MQAGCELLQNENETPSFSDGHFTEVNVFTNITAAYEHRVPSERILLETIVLSFI
jgi:hypothetical protein